MIIPCLHIPLYILYGSVRERNQNGSLKPFAASYRGQQNLQH